MSISCFTEFFNSKYNFFFIVHCQFYLGPRIIWDTQKLQNLQIETKLFLKTMQDCLGYTEIT